MEKSLEQILLSKSIAGDTEAFGKLIRLYKNNLYGYLWKLCKDNELSHDLFQETLIKVWKGLPNYDEQNKFSSWLFSIAHNVASDSFRKIKVRNRVVHTDNIPENVNSITQQHHIEAGELKFLLDKKIDSLPKKQKQVLLLRQHGELTFREIAEITNQPLNTVLSHMNYAVKKLKNILREENVI